MNRFRAMLVTRDVTRIVLLVAIAACGSSKPAETPPLAKTAPPAIVPAECESTGAHATYDGRSVTVTKNDVSLGTAACAMTAMAVFSVACRGSTFDFLYAGIPGTSAIGGKSAQLGVNGTIEMMDCHAPTTKYVCTDGAESVVYDGGTATYSSSGTLVGASQCGGTRMAVYNMACVQNPAFRFYFASVPGPAILGGKSARLDAGGKTTLMACK